MIAIVYPQFYGVGGIARYLDSFLENLPEYHPKIYLITGDEHKVERRYHNVEIIHIPFSSNRFNLLFWTIKAKKILEQLYIQQKIGVVNLHIPPLIPGLLLPSHIPLILTAHTTYTGMSGRFYKKNYFDSQWSWLEVTIKEFMESLIFRRAKRVIALTEQGKQELLTYGVKAPIDIIPNGVDISLFTPMDNHVKNYDVIFCGRIEHRKGSRAMVEVCKHLVRNKPDIRILIVGYGDDDKWVNQQLQQHTQNIKLTGKAKFEEVQSYYNQSQIYVSTSYYEGLPGTCIEAMSMALPAIVWDFLFYRGLVQPNKTGQLIEPNNVELMANKIIELLSNPEHIKKMSIEARACVEKNYNWQHLSTEVLQKLLS